jgi:hypothetical protein
MTEEIKITPLQARTAEVAQYEANIALYQTILATLPTTWPEHLTQYRGSKNKHDVIATISDLADVELLSKLWYADDCAKAIRTETLEMTKAKAILATLQA